MTAIDYHYCQYRLVPITSATNSRVENNRPVVRANCRYGKYQVVTYQGSGVPVVGSGAGTSHDTAFLLTYLRTNLRGMLHACAGFQMQDVGMNTKYKLSMVLMLVLRTTVLRVLSIDCRPHTLQEVADDSSSLAFASSVVSWPQGIFFFYFFSRFFFLPFLCHRR